MGSRFLRTVTVFALIGLAGVVPDADAAHDIKDKNGVHESSPRPPSAPDIDASCFVSGQFFVDNANGNGGIGAIEVNHNHYQLEDFIVLCEPLSNEGLAIAPAMYAVNAAGGTDGIADATLGTTTHGEDLRVGWSHQSCYDDQQPQGEGDCDFSNSKVDDLYDGTNENPAGSGKCSNCGEIEVQEIAGTRSSTSTDNWVKFCRGDYFDPNVGGDALGATCSNLDNNLGGAFPVRSGHGADVITWGALADWVNIGTTNEFCFLGQLSFEPTSINGAPKFGHAVFLDGRAVVWAVDDKSACAGDKGAKVE